MKQPFCERLVYKRFSPLEQYGCAAGGTTHVIATLLAGAEIDADSFAPGISDFKRMRQHGVKERLIQQMVKMAVKESRLQVTDDAHLMLIDYDNKEVKMLPIDKVVYIFFLRHPEGVAQLIVWEQWGY